MNPRGGTEILWSNFCKYVDKSHRDRVNIILSDCNPELLRKDVPNILWQHVNTDQRVAQGCKIPSFVVDIDHWVYVSEWQRQRYYRDFVLPHQKYTVIPNAIEPIEWIDRPKDKLRLIYTSTPWRGLEILLEAFKRLNRQDVELDVYSSTVIYGSKFMPNQYDWLFNRCKTTPRVNYHGYATNKGVRRALQNAHIFAYPSIFEETSCLAAIEAGAAGCSIVTTNFGALPETCGQYATYVQYTRDYDRLIENYTEVLNQQIDNYWSMTEVLKQQSDYFNTHYSWHNRKTQWEQLIKTYA